MSTLTDEEMRQVFRQVFPAKRARKSELLRSEAMRFEGRVLIVGPGGEEEVLEPIQDAVVVEDPK